MISTPRFFYFDMGNVLLHFDHDIACQQMASVAGVSTDRVRQIVFQSDLEWRYERGELSSREFYREFCRQSESNANFDELKRAAAAIFQMNEPVERIVRQLESRGMRLGILSNTCQAHWEYVTDGRYELLPGPFSVIALSYELGAMKPEEKIYPAAAKLAGFAPAEIFFVDDREENVVAALEAGFDAVQFTSPEDLTEELRRRGTGI